MITYHVTVNGYELTAHPGADGSVLIDGKELTHEVQRISLDAGLNVAVTGDGEPSLVWEPTYGAEPPVEAVLLGAADEGAYWALDRPELPVGGGGGTAASAESGCVTSGSSCRRARPGC